MFKKQVVVFL